VVKVHGHRRKNVVKMVSVTSNNGFLLTYLLLIANSLKRVKQHIGRSL